MKKCEAQNLRISDYNYDLPNERVAKYPLQDRSASKLLQFDNGLITTNMFTDISSLIPHNSLMIFNNTRVIHARLFFKKDTGAVIEVFCLNPVIPQEYELNFQQTKRVVWNCIIGNAKRWKDNVLYLEIVVDGITVLLSAKKLSKSGDSYKVEFSWDNPSFTFSEILELAGKLPIPPYLNRESESKDDKTYQTVYSEVEGSVAAPTAGLHFTPDLLSVINSVGIKTNHVTLHVGAGTFKPIKSTTLGGHHMHSEYIVISRSLIQDLIDNIGCIIVVGTTSMRTIESLYYIGKQIVENSEFKPDIFFVAQWEPYEENNPISPIDSLKAIVNYMDNNGKSFLYAETEIIIVPGYVFHFPSAIITNFHQPESTLLLLISAFVGPGWREIYDFALENNYRFLSYGDSSLLWRR